MDHVTIIVKPETEPEHPMLLRCPIDGEEYWSDKECPRTAIHEKILTS